MKRGSNLLRLTERPIRPRAHGQLDKIFLTDYVVECFIGAFEEEKGIKQRVRFSVDMWIYPSRRRSNDDVNSVVSYDLIVEAINSTACNGHVHLVETLAERIAAKCLSHKRAARIKIRVEKLDRIEGASLGVEIERSKSPVS